MHFRRNTLLLCLFLSLALLPGIASAQLTPKAIRFPNDIIDLHLESHNDRLFTTVTIDDQDYRFLFDTGALTVVTQSLADQHRLSSGERIRISDSSNQRQKMGFCRIPELKLSELSILELPATIFPDDNPIFECLEVDGILGANAFSRTAITIDTQAGILSIFKSYPDELPGQLKLNNQNSPYLVTMLVDQEITFFFDSGSASYGEISKRSYRKAKHTFTKIAELQGIRSWGAHGFAKPKRFNLYETDELMFADTKIPRYPFAEGEANTLGAPLLRHGVLTLDYENRKWGFQSFDPLPETSINRVPIAPLPIDGRWQVGTYDRSLKGIRVGDEVVAIEGIDLSTISLCDLITGDLKKLILNKEITIRTKNGDIKLGIRSLRQ